MAVINTTSKNLKSYKSKMYKDVVRLVENAITDVQIAATVDAPKFVNIDKKFSEKGLVGEVGVMGDFEGTHIAAYIEFGTGLSAQQILAGYPQWIKDIAWEFYVNGLGTLKGKPYLYNNFLVVLEKFKKDLKELVDGQDNGD